MPRLRLRRPPPRARPDAPWPLSKSLFQTLKYRPDYPAQPFAELAACRRWVGAFVRWYNTEHLHSAIRFVTPADRHPG